MSDPAREWVHNLTPREQEVLGRIGRGLDNKSIAREMGIGHGTARKHVAQVLSKLGVHSKLEAAALLLAQERESPDA